MSLRRHRIEHVCRMPLDWDTNFLRHTLQTAVTGGGGVRFHTPVFRLMSSAEIFLRRISWFLHSREQVSFLNPVRFSNVLPQIAQVPLIIFRLRVCSTGIFSMVSAFAANFLCICWFLHICEQVFRSAPFLVTNDLPQFSQTAFTGFRIRFGFSISFCISVMGESYHS